MTGNRSKLLAIVFLLTYSFSTAQNISVDTDSVLWKVSKFYNSSNQETVNNYSEFKTGRQTITWLQDNGDDVYQFSIVLKQGSWKNTDSNGNVTYTVNWHDLPGTISFRRQNGAVKITMEFLKDGQNIMPYVFSVLDIRKI